MVKYHFGLQKLNAESLLRELGIAGFGLTGQNQEGSLNSSGNDVEIVFPEPVDPVRYDALAAVISAHTGEEPYDIRRRERYLELGVTADAMIVAVWERDVEGRPESANALQAIRQQVKAEIPKPV